MSGILLDTHVALWSAYKSHRVSKALLTLFDKTTDVYVSSISLAEIAMKQAAGKLKISSAAADDLAEIGFKIVAFEAEAATSVSRFKQLANHDPFDWLLLAQAASLGATFVTADNKLLTLGLDWVIDAQA